MRHEQSWHHILINEPVTYPFVNSRRFKPCDWLSLALEISRACNWKMSVRIFSRPFVVPFFYLTAATASRKETSCRVLNVWLNEQRLSRPSCHDLHPMSVCFSPQVFLTPNRSQVINNGGLFVIAAAVARGRLEAVKDMICTPDGSRRIPTEYSHRHQSSYLWLLFI